MTIHSLAHENHDRHQCYGNDDCRGCDDQNGRMVRCLNVNHDIPNMDQHLGMSCMTKHQQGYSSNME